MGRRLGWGVADQAMSSLTNFAVNIYIARTLGVAQYGAFSLAYVTYSFALNASRGLATDPLMVRFSGTDLPTWRRAVAACTGTATVVGTVTGACVVAAAIAFEGPIRLAFLALGLTLPALLLQDSWRFSFFALGRGHLAFLNDMAWAIALLPALALLQVTGHKNVFWFLLAWGATAAVGAAIGPLQSRIIPRVTGTREWLSGHRDLGVRFLAEGATNSVANQLRNYGLGLIGGLAVVGYVQAANTLMGPFMVVIFGLALVLVPEAARALRRSRHDMLRFCMLISGGLTVVGFAWGVVLLIALPHGLGTWTLGHLWRPTYPLVLPVAISMAGGCASTGPGTGLHALGAAKRSLRAMVITSAAAVPLTLTGAYYEGAVGAMRGAAVASWIGALVYWWELRSALREHAQAAQPDRPDTSRKAGRHRLARTD